MRGVYISCVVALCCGLVSPAAGDTLMVPSQYATIQAGVNAATEGDIVLVAPGTYTGAGNRDISFAGKAITVRSSGGAATTIIDCQNLGRGFRFANNERLDSVVDGFTIKDGLTQAADPEPDGAGIYCASGAYPTIRNCIITSCASGRHGGGMYYTYANAASALVENCVFSSNQAERFGAGLYAGAQIAVWGCEFNGNQTANGSLPGRGGALYLAGGSTSTIYGCVFVGNAAHQGGAIYVDGDPASVRNCLFAANSSFNGGGVPNDGGAVYANSTFGTSYFYNTTFAANTADEDGDSFLVGDSEIILISCILWDSPDNGIVIDGSGSVTAHYSDIRDAVGVYPGTANINDDPLFFPGPQGNYYLSQVAAGQASTSPCVDSGFLDAADTDSVDADPSHTLADRTTRTDEVGDSGTTDMGYHYPLPVIFADGFESGGVGAWSSSQSRQER